MYFTIPFKELKKIRPDLRSLNLEEDAIVVFDNGEMRIPTEEDKAAFGFVFGSLSPFDEKETP